MPISWYIWDWKNRLLINSYFFQFWKINLPDLRQTHLLKLSICNACRATFAFHVSSSCTGRLVSTYLYGEFMKLAVSTNLGCKLQDSLAAIRIVFPPSGQGRQRETREWDIIFPGWLATAWRLHCFCRWYSRYWHPAPRRQCWAISSESPMQWMDCGKQSWAVQHHLGWGSGKEW